MNNPDAGTSTQRAIDAAVHPAQLNPKLLEIIGMLQPRSGLEADGISQRPGEHSWPLNRHSDGSLPDAPCLI